MKIVNKIISIFWLIISPLILISCNKNEVANHNNTLSQFQSYDRKFTLTKLNDSSLLSKQSYNQIVDELNQDNKALAIVVIYSEKSYFQKVNYHKGYTLWDYLKNKLDKISFKSFKAPALGVWIGPFYFKDNSQKLLYGKSQNSNYGMKGYPLLYYNHQYAQLGVSNYYPRAGQIIEITYDHTS